MTSTSSPDAADRQPDRQDARFLDAGRDDHRRQTDRQRRAAANRVAAGRGFALAWRGSPQHRRFCARPGHLVRRDVAPERQRFADIRYRLEAAARAPHDDRAVAENSPEDRLVDADGLDFRPVDLDRVAPDDAGLEDYPAIGDGELGRRPLDERAHGGDKTQKGKHAGGDLQRDRDPGVTVRPAEPARCNQAQYGGDQQQNGLEIDQPMQAGGVDHALARLQYLLDIFHCWDPRTGKIGLLGRAARDGRGLARVETVVQLGALPLLRQHPLFGAAARRGCVAVTAGAQRAHPVEPDLDDADARHRALVEDRLRRRDDREAAIVRRHQVLRRDDERQVLDRARPQEGAPGLPQRCLFMPAGMKISSAPRNANARVTSGM